MKRFLSVMFPVLVFLLLISNLSVRANDTEAQEYQNTIEIIAEDGEDVTRKLINELNSIGELNADYVTRILLPKDLTLELSAVCSIYSNTYLDLNGSVLVRTNTTEGSMFRVGDADDMVTAYAYQNITIANGTIDGAYKTPSNLMRIGHAQNIKIQNLTFTRNKNSHCIEVAATKDLVIADCTFTDVKVTNGSPCECIQLDPLYQEVYSYYGEYDKTVTRNVEIYNCRFENVNRGIGSHNLMVGNYFYNINIHDNTFTNLKEQAIATLGWSDSVIENNTITECSRGIIVQSVISTHTAMYIQDGFEINEKNTNIVIKNNEIKLKNAAGASLSKSVAIQVYGDRSVPKKYYTNRDDYLVEDVTIEGNTITTDANGIKLFGTINSAIKDNTFTCTESNKVNAIYVGEDCSDVLIDGNQITGFNKDNNIMVTGGAQAVKINGNTITTTNSKSAIIIYKSSNASAITNNVISAKGQGVNINTNSSCTKISGNSISGAKYGIALFAKSSAKYIRYNTVIGGENGIYVYSSSKGGSIKGNTVSKQSQSNVMISRGSTATIAENKLTSAKQNGIYVYKATTTASDNAISKAKYGIKVYDSKITASGNTIKTSGAYGIYATSKSTVKLDSNTMSGAKKDVVYVSGGTLTMSSNEITGGKAYGVHILNAKATASKDKVHNNKVGVYVHGTGKLTAKYAKIYTNSQSGLQLQGEGYASLKSCNIYSNKYGIRYTKKGAFKTTKCSIKKNTHNKYKG